MKTNRKTEVEFEKPRLYRDRSKKRRGEQPEREHPIHQPYHREHKNWTHNVVVDGLGEDFDE